jgi:hypothetical protein
MFTPYSPRALQFLGIREFRGYQLKVYSIVYGNAPFDSDSFEAGLQVAIRELPHPPVTDERPGLGFAILHQGRTGKYLIMSWWDRENELPAKVFIAYPDGWHLAQHGESFCVWDLRVLWWERESYIGTVLSGHGNGVEAYLSSVISGYA